MVKLYEQKHSMVGNGRPIALSRPQTPPSRLEDS